MVPQKKMSSVPWVKHINSIGTVLSSEDKIKSTERIVQKLKPTSAQVFKSVDMPAAAGTAEDDEMAGMPVLVPCINISKTASQVSIIFNYILSYMDKF